MNSGKALEDLRASLFSDLHSSEGAKRLQQRICGPTVALTFNFMVSVGIILMNKLVRLHLFLSSSEAIIIYSCNDRLIDCNGIFFSTILGAWESRIQLSNLSHIHSLCFELVPNGYSQRVFASTCISFNKVDPGFFSYSPRHCHVSLQWPCQCQLEV